MTARPTFRSPSPRLPGRPFQPRALPRDEDNMPHIEHAERSVWRAAHQDHLSRRGVLLYHLMEVNHHCKMAGLHLVLVDGPRSVRTRARRLWRRAERMRARALAAMGVRTA